MMFLEVAASLQGFGNMNEISASENPAPTRQTGSISHYSNLHEESRH